VKHENINTECYFLIPATDNQTVKIDIKTNFYCSNTKITINVIALASDNASITLNWNLHILDKTNKVEARLYEETLVIWDAKYISMVPGLRVDSPDVIASHWAKIQRISPERIFYMQSRWLDSKKAVWMILNSYSQEIVDKLWLNEEEQIEFYSMIK
jgi:Fe-S cluster assembly scaffold protein SufB